MKSAFRVSSLLSVLLGLCAMSLAGQFTQVTKYKLSDGATGHSVAVGDFNGDNVPDIVLTSETSVFGLWILLGKGDGTFLPAQPIAGGGGLGLTVADFNRDGKLDLATVFANSQGGGLNIQLGNGDGTLQAPVFYPAGPWPTTVAVADFNGDGTPDLAVGSPLGAFGNQQQKGGIAVLLGNGDGTFQSYTLYSSGFHPNSPVVSNLDSDSIPDIASGTTGSIVAVLPGKGDGTFRAAITNRLGVNPHYVGTGDFNNDGKADVITTLENTTTGQNKVVIALGNGDGTLQAPITVPSPNPQATAVADFNLDGVDDIAIGIAKTPLDGIYVLLGQGNASFVHEGTYPTGTLVPTAIAVGDLNRDGYPDLVILDGSDSVEVLLNSGGSH